MERDARARHAGSFGAVAADYAAARPSYPAEAVDWLTGPAPHDVLDLGAGTGKLTELLVAAGHRVTAVDPSAGMLDQLRDRLPDVVTAEGPAEHVPLPDAGFDVVTVAQAWHWFDPALAPAECGRLLRAGGRLGLVWNERDESVDWVGAIWEPLNRSGGTGIGLLSDDWSDSVVGNGPFGPMERAVFRYEQPLSRDGVLQLISTRSAVAVLEPPAKAAIMGEIGGILDTHPDTRDRETFVLPYETRCFRWRRLD